MKKIYSIKKAGPVFVEFLLFLACLGGLLDLRIFRLLCLWLWLLSGVEVVDGDIVELVHHLLHLIWLLRILLLRIVGLRLLHHHRLLRRVIHLLSINPMSWSHLLRIEMLLGQVVSMRHLLVLQLVVAVSKLAIVSEFAVALLSKPFAQRCFEGKSILLLNLLPDLLFVLSQLFSIHALAGQFV